MRRLDYTMAAIVAVALLTAAPTAAQEAEEENVPVEETAIEPGNAAFQEAFRRGNRAYNESRYDMAREAYVEAIQAAPTRPRAYRNLARTHFWLDQYAAAVPAYDNYLQLAPDAEDIEQIKSERRLAADRAGENVWTLPEAQHLTLEALNDELESGRAYTRGGGGAWGLYQTLLRTGYAQPNLERIRTRLVRRILDEFDAIVVPEKGALTPHLDLQAWQLQAERLGVARELSDDEAMLEVINRRSTIVEAAISMLTGSPGDAAKLARLAYQSNPDLYFVRWFEIASFLEAQKHDAALEATEEVARELLEGDRGKLDYARTLRAVVLKRLGRHEDAAGIYYDILSKPSR